MSLQRYLRVEVSKSSIKSSLAVPSTTVETQRIALLSFQNACGLGPKICSPEKLPRKCLLSPPPKEQMLERKVQWVNKQLKVSCFTHLLATNLAFNSCSLFSAPHTVLAAANRIFSFLRKQLFYFTLHDYLFQGVNQNLGLICFTYCSQ